MKKLLFLATAAVVVLSSCSKDTTEVVSVKKSDNVVFTGSMSFETNETRLTLTGDLGDEYFVWNTGDAVGVASLTATGANIPAYNTGANGSTTSEFSVDDNDLLFFGDNWGKEMFAYYPYNPEAVSVLSTNDPETATIALTIPAKQLYKKDGVHKTAVPALGYIPEYTTGSEMAFTTPAAMLRVPVTGLGTIKTLKLQILDLSNNPIALTGDCDVAVAPLTDDDNTTKPSFTQPAEVVPDVNDYITIDCGTGIPLSYTLPTQFYFVLPAGIDYKDCKFQFTANGEGTPFAEYAGPEVSYTTVANQIDPLNNGIVYGLDGKVLIQDVYDLIAYAYNDRDGGLDNTTEAYLISSDDYNFTTYNEGVVAEYDALRAYAGTAGLTPAELTAAEAKMAILKWYIDNGCAIEPLATGAIVGGNQAAATITGLKVKGDYAIYTDVSNITLTNLSTSNRVFFGASTVNKIGKNVTINTPAVDYVFADIYANSVNDLNGIGFSVVGENVVYGNQLKVDENITIADKFNKVIAVDTKTAVVTAAAELKDEVLASVDAGTPIAANGYYSVIIDGTSYWTGEVATSVIEDDYFTAEELALAVVNRGSATLKGVNIDLQNKNWTPVLNDAGNGYLTVNGAVDAENNVLYSISNVNIEVVKDGETVVESTSGTNGYALFGLKANMYNLVVEDLTINLDNLTNETYIGGLACRTNGVDNVTVNGGTVNIGKNITTDNTEKYQCFGVVAGKIASAVESVNNCTVNGVSLQSMDKDTFDYGMVFGAFELENGKDIVFENISTDKKASLIGLAYVNVPVFVAADAPEITLTNCTAAEGAKTVIRRIAWSNTNQNYYIEINNTPFNHTKTSY